MKGLMFLHFFLAILFTVLLVQATDAASKQYCLTAMLGNLILANLFDIKLRLSK